MALTLSKLIIFKAEMFQTIFSLDVFVELKITLSGNPDSGYQIKIANGSPVHPPHKLLDTTEQLYSVSLEALFASHHFKPLCGSGLTSLKTR